ncbi:hypothetical protein D3C75_1124280 [compost metagenome]
MNMTFLFDEFLLYPEPACIAGIITCLQLQLTTVYQSHIRATDDPCSRIAAYVSPCIQLFQIDIVQSRLRL